MAVYSKQYSKFFSLIFFYVKIDVNGFILKAGQPFRSPFESICLLLRVCGLKFLIVIILHISTSNHIISSIVTRYTKLQNFKWTIVLKEV